jgi:lysozyme family protein
VTAPAPISRTDEEIISRIIAREGGYVNHPADKGGPTNMGVTQATLADWRGKSVAADDVRALTREEAVAIYRARYLVEPKFDQIADAALRELVVDCGVLHGAGRAARWLQQAVAAKIDGKVGPQTLAAVNAADARVLGIRLTAIRVRALADIVAGNPTQLVFLRGWTRRAVEFLERTEI